MSKRFSQDNYPEEFESLHPEARKKAIFYANELLRENVNEEKAISEAKKKAKVWFARHKDEGESRKRKKKRDLKESGYEDLKDSV